MVMQEGFKYPDTKAYEYVKRELRSHGVGLTDIAKIVWEMEYKYIPDLEVGKIIEEIDNVLHKREVLNNIMTGLFLDKAAQRGVVDYPLQEIIENDAGVYGVDETLAIQIANIYGSVGVSNFGYLDKAKTGIMSDLDNQGGQVNTFIDDIVGAVAAAVCGKLAHATA